MGGLILPGGLRRACIQDMISPVGFPVGRHPETDRRIYRGIWTDRPGNGEQIPRNSATSIRRGISPAGGCISSEMHYLPVDSPMLSRISCLMLEGFWSVAPVLAPVSDSGACSDVVGIEWVGVFDGIILATGRNRRR